MKRSMWLYFFASVVRQKEKFSVMYSIKGFCICANSRTYGYIAYCLQTPQTFCDFWSWCWHYKKVSFLKGEYGAHFLHWNQNSKFWVTWPRIAQSVYFLRKMCLFFNFWMIKFTIMCFFFDIHAWNFSTKVIYMSKNTLPSKNIQTEQN